MCKKGYKQTKEHRENISKGQLGNKRSDETRKLQSELKQGYIPWNKGKKNIYSQETLNKMSESAKVKVFSKEHRENISKANRGCKNPMYGSHGWNYGKHHSEETRYKMSNAQLGEKHPNWQGGISFEPYCPKFNKPTKEKIRKRDNYQCQYPICLRTQLENLLLYNQSLHVHHVHYDKPNCNPDLIALCTKHNIIANGKRDYHEKLFMDILKNRNLLKYED